MHTDLETISKQEVTVFTLKQKCCSSSIKNLKALNIKQHKYFVKLVKR